MAGLAVEPTDAELLAAVRAETVNFAYSGSSPSGSIPPTVEQHRATWIERLSDPTATAFVTHHDGEIRGTVLTRAGPDSWTKGRSLGCTSLPAAWRRGVGAALHDHALVVLRRAEYRQVGLWMIAKK
jgi:hypothetical protein